MNMLNRCRVSFGSDRNVLELDKWWWLHNIVSLLNATKLYSLKLLILCYMNCTLKNKSWSYGTSTAEEAAWPQLVLSWSWSHVSLPVVVEKLELLLVWVVFSSYFTALWSHCGGVYKSWAGHGWGQLVKPPSRLQSLALWLWTTLCWLCHMLAAELRAKYPKPWEAQLLQPGK